MIETCLPHAYAVQMNRSKCLSVKRTKEDTIEGEKEREREIERERERVENIPKYLPWAEQFRRPWL